MTERQRTPRPTGGTCCWPARSSADCGTRDWRPANPSGSETVPWTPPPSVRSGTAWTGSIPTAGMWPEHRQGYKSGTEATRASIRPKPPLRENLSKISPRKACRQPPAPCSSLR